MDLDPVISLPGRKGVGLSEQTLGEQFENRVRQPKELDGGNELNDNKAKFQWMEYWKSSALEDTLNSCIQSLLNLEELPDNPFIYLANRIRVEELRRHSVFTKVIHDNNNKIDATDPKTGITTLVGSNKFWSWEEVLQFLDFKASFILVQSLKKIDRLLCSSKTHQKGYIIQKICAVTGAASFYGRILPYLPNPVQLDTHIIIDGRRFEKAINLFANELINDAQILDASKGVVLFSVNIELPGNNKQDNLQEVKNWSIEEIKQSKPTFISAIKGALVSKRKISFDLLVILDDSFCKHQKHSGFINIEKSYELCFRKISDPNKDSFSLIRCFCKYPLSCVVNGYFLSREDAMLYCSMFINSNGDKLHLEQAHGYLLKVKTNLAQNYLSGDICASVELLLCLCAVNRYTVALADIMRFASSPAGGLRAVANEIENIKRLLLKCTENERRRQSMGSYIRESIVNRFPYFRARFFNLLGSKINTESLLVTKMIQQQLSNICNPISRELIITSETAQCFQRLEHICHILNSTVTKDVIEILDGADYLKLQCRDPEDTFTLLHLFELVLKQLEELPHKKKEEQGAELGLKAAASLRELETAERLRDTQLIISKAKEFARNKKTGRFPANVAREATLIQYLVDSRVDIVLHDIFMDLFTGGKLAPNPFPTILQKMCSEAARHSMWREVDSDLHALMELTPGHTRLTNVENRIYRVLNVEQVKFQKSLHGTKTAIHLCNGTVMATLLDQIHPTICSIDSTLLMQIRKQHSQYDISINTGLGGDIQLYSRLNKWRKPHLYILNTHEVTLYENHVIEGAQSDGAIELYGEIIIQHSTQFHGKGNSILLGIYTGKKAMDLLNVDFGNEGGWKQEIHLDPALRNKKLEERRNNNITARVARERQYHPRYIKGEHMIYYQLKRNKSECLDEITRATKAREPIVVQLAVFIDKLGSGEHAKYIVVHKQMGLVLVNSDSAQPKSYLPYFLEIDSLYRAVWITEAQAVSAIQALNLLYNKTRRSDPDDPKCPSFILYIESLKLKVAHAYHRGDCLLACKALLRLALIKDMQSIIPDLTRILSTESLCQQLGHVAVNLNTIHALLNAQEKDSHVRTALPAIKVKQQYHGCRTSFEEVLARPDCIYFHGIRNKIHSLLIKVHDHLEKIPPGESGTHINHIEELQMYAQCLRVAASNAAISNCPEIIKICRLYCTELISTTEKTIL